MSAPRQSRTTRSRGLVPRLAVVAALATGTALALAASQSATAGIVPTVQLATAGNYSVLGASTVTNTDTPTVLGQSLGLSPGTAITGFPPGTVVAPATIEAHNAVTEQAQIDLTTAYVDAAGRSVEFTQPNPDLVGQTLLPGVYAAAEKAPLALSGQLVLDGQDNPDAVFIFQTDSTLITSSGSTIVLINGASECNVFWQVGSSATLGSGSSFVGTILALTSITVESSTVVRGRALARNGAVTLDNNVFTEPSCEPSTDIAPTSTAPSTTTTTTTPVTTAPPTTVGEGAITTTSTTILPVTDDTLPPTGGSLPTQSGIGFAVVLLGLATMAIARRRQPA